MSGASCHSMSTTESCRWTRLPSSIRRASEPSWRWHARRAERLVVTGAALLDGLTDAPPRVVSIRRGQELDEWPADDLLLGVLRLRVVDELHALVLAHDDDEVLGAFDQLAPDLLTGQERAIVVLAVVQEGSPFSDRGREVSSSSTEGSWSLRSSGTDTPIYSHQTACG